MRGCRLFQPAGGRECKVKMQVNPARKDTTRVHPRPIRFPRRTSWIWVRCWMSGRGRPEELAAVLRHQLSSPVKFEMRGLGAAGERACLLAEAQQLVVKSFADLLHHPLPPIELLKLTKDYCKSHQREANPAVPREISIVIYYASIVAAGLRHGIRISELPDEKLLQGVKSALAHPWLDSAPARFFRTGCASLKARQEARHEFPALQRHAGCADTLYPVSSEGGLPPPAGASQRHPTLDQLLRDGLLDAPRRPGIRACVDDFEIEDVAGVGGMAIVLRGFDPALKEQVAVKVLRPELAARPEIAERFLQEARIMHRQNHRNLLKVRFVRAQPPRLYYVMPYLSRGSLLKKIRDAKGPINDGQTLADVAGDVAAALKYLHDLGLVHGDVKAANVLLADTGDWLLADLGLTQHAPLTAGGPPNRAGTLTHLPPGQAAGREEGKQKDIYAIGALLYEMLTARPPYSDSTNPAEMASRIESEPPAAILALNPSAPRKWVAVAETAMSREQRRRYASIDDLIADLHRIAPQPPPPGGRWRILVPVANEPGDSDHGHGAGACRVGCRSIALPSLASQGDGQSSSPQPASTPIGRIPPAHR